MLRRSPSLLRTLLAGALFGAAFVGVGCGGVDDSGDGAVAVAMQPRVVLDGTIELSDRTAGRVIIDEVIAHAPFARLHSLASDIGDVVVDASDPLLFRYALADRSGFGAALPSLSDGAERVWSVPVDGTSVDVAFDAAADDIAADYDAHSDVLTGLGGHTLIVHGTIAVETEVRSTIGGFGDLDDGDAVSDVDPDGTPATDPEGDVDPDGGAALPGALGGSSKGDVSDVDPDGGAAHPTGDTSDVDPDGGAASDPDGDREGDVSDVDPDGGAASNPDKVSDVDPDGTPAAGGNLGEGRDGDAKRPDKSVKAHGMTGRRVVVNVPFSLVTDGSFRREVVLDADDIAAVDAGEVMPLDLHLSASELLDGDRLAELEAVAADALAEDDAATVVVNVPQKVTAAASTVKAPGSIKKPTHVVEGSSRIRVSGDLRR